MFIAAVVTGHTHGDKAGALPRQHGRNQLVMHWFHPCLIRSNTSMVVMVCVCVCGCVLDSSHILWYPCFKSPNTVVFWVTYEYALFIKICRILV